jgi:hypothetical protein
MPVPFETYPRRLVRLPDHTSGLVLIRRNVDARYNWLNGWDVAWEGEQLARLLRRDRRWLVEFYPHITEDPLGRPDDDALRFWITADKAAAVALAGRVVRAVERGGVPALDELDVRGPRA